MIPVSQTDRSESASVDLAGAAVGVVSSWGNFLGRDRVSRRIVEHLSAVDAEVHLMAEAGLGPEGTPQAVTLQEYSGDAGSIARWVREHSLRAVIFSENGQGQGRGTRPGQTEACQLLHEAAEAGGQPFGYLVWERFFAEQLDQYRPYAAVLSPHDAFCERLRQDGLSSVPFRWGWRLPLPKPRLPDDAPLELIHCAGASGGATRKATGTVGEAFLQLAAEPGFRFRVCSQGPLADGLSDRLRDAGVEVEEASLPTQRLEAFIRSARVSVQPSRWEGIGLPILESLMVGTPVVTTAGPPMNQWVRHKREGLLVPCEEGSHPGVAVPTREASVDSLVETLLLLRDRDLLEVLEKGAAAGGPARLGPEEAARQLADGIVEHL